MVLRFVCCMALVTICAGCLALPTPHPSQRFVTGEQLLDETFDSPGDWDTYHLQGAYLQVEDGGYRIRADISRYVFGLNHQQYDNVVIEVEAYLKSEYRKGILGVICRASSGSKGYYFVVSADGNFSIRRGAGNAIDPLVQWQAADAVNTETGRNLLRVICIDDYLALYINGKFIAEATDTYYHRGAIGLTAALPTRAKSGDIVDVIFDNLRVWAGE